MLSPGEAFKLSLTRWNDFQGRSRRSEYWWTTVFVLVITSAIGLLDEIVSKSTYPDDYFTKSYDYFSLWLIEFKVYPLSTIAVLIFMIPIFAVSIRRMHDVGRTGWWIGIPLGISYFAWPIFDVPSYLIASEPAHSEVMLLFRLQSVLFAILCITGLISLYFCLVDGDAEGNDFGETVK